MTSTVSSLSSTPRRRWPAVTASSFGGLTALVWAVNFGLVGHPVNSSLSADRRNAGFALSAHFAYFVDPTVVFAESSSPLLP